MLNIYHSFFQFLTELHSTTAANVSLAEAAMLLILAAVAFGLRKHVVLLPLLYTIFLIVYITVLRRAPGYDGKRQLRRHLDIVCQT